MYLPFYLVCTYTWPISAHIILGVNRCHISCSTLHACALI